jgi:hypothetical protein
LLDSLGLFETRFKSVVDITSRFLADQEVVDCLWSLRSFISYSLIRAHFFL